MEETKLNRKQHLKIFEDHYLQYIKFYNPNISQEEIEKRLNHLKKIFSIYINRNPYKVFDKNKIFIEAKTEQIFNNLIRKSPIELETITVVEAIVDNVFTDKLEPKKRWQLVIEKWSPHVISILAFLFSIFTFVWHLQTGTPLNQWICL